MEVKVVETKVVGRCQCGYPVMAEVYANGETVTWCVNCNRACWLLEVKDETH